MQHSRSKYPVAYVLQEISKIMNNDLGIVRDEDGLKEGLESVDFYLNVLNSLSFDPTVSLYENYRIYYMVVLAKAILSSALERRESRGAHYRADYPEQREEYQKNSAAEFRDKEIRIHFEQEREEIN